jgi:hypothetical protein
MADPATKLQTIAPPTVQQVTANTSAVSKESTVAGQMDGLLKQDSNYMNLAKQQGKQQAASRGLLNSSMAAGSSMAAATAAALPIAQQDATTQFTNMRDNDSRTFAASQQNAQAGNTSNNTAFDLTGKGALADQGYAQQQGINAQQSELTKAQDAWRLMQQKDLNTQQAGFATAQDQARYEQQQGLNKQQAEIQNKQDLLKFDQQKDLTAQGALNDIGMQKLRGQQSVDLANIEANYKNLLQTNASAQEMWKSYNEQISKLISDKDLKAEHVTNAIQVSKDSFTAGLGLLGAVSGIDLQQYASLAPTASTTGAAPGSFVSGPSSTPVPIPAPITEPKVPNRSHNK